MRLAPRAARLAVLGAAVVLVPLSIAYARLVRPIELEPWHGLQWIVNAALVRGEAAGGMSYSMGRPPLGTLLLTTAGPLSSGGARALLRRTRTLMSGLFAATVLAAFAFFVGLVSLPAAAVAAVLFAADPLVLLCAPFAYFDILAAAALIGFLAASRRYFERMDGPSLALLAAAYSCAVMTRHHLALLAPLPSIALLLSRGRPKMTLALFSVLLAAATLSWWGLETLLLLRQGLSMWSAALAPWGLLRTELALNVNAGAHVPAWVYAESLVERAGIPALALAGGGALAWLRAPGPFEKLLALSLIVPMAALCGPITNRNERFALFLGPLLYLAAVSFVDRLPKRELRAVGLAVLLLAAPWGRAARVLKQLAADPVLREPVPGPAGRAERAVEFTPAVGKVGVLIFQLEPPMSDFYDL